MFWKFKISVIVLGDNFIDVYIYDISLVVIIDCYGELWGFNVLVGGGLGCIYNKEEIFVWVVDFIGYVSKDDVYDLVKVIVVI